MLTKMYTFLTLIIYLIAISTGPTCTMSAELSAEGYEEREDKYYRLYHGGDRADHFGASLKCQSVGARLALMKTQQDFDAASYYRGNLCKEIVSITFQINWSC